MAVGFIPVDGITQIDADIEAGALLIPWVGTLSNGEYLDVSMSGVDLFGQFYDADSNKIGDSFLITSDTTFNKFTTAITPLEGGGFLVLWMSDGQDGSDYGIYGQRFDATGAAVGSEFQVNTYTDSNQSIPTITALNDGGFVIAWESYGQDGSDYGIFGQRFDATGAPAGSEFQINTQTAGPQISASVTSLADGGFVVVWTTGYIPGLPPIEVEGVVYGVFGQRYDASGTPVGGEFQIMSSSGTDIYPTVVADADGGFFIQWYDGTDYFMQQFAPQLFGTSGDDTITDNVGANWINGRGGDDVLDGGAGIGNDEIYGGLGNDTLSGWDGRDKLYGGLGADTLNGGGRNDVLKGGYGADVLNGGVGNDRLVGGAGKDTLSGGGGADVFVFINASDSRNNEKADVITDFETDVDHLDLSAIGGLTFIGSDTFSGTSAEVRTTISGTDTLVWVDVNGDGVADMNVVLEGVTGLSGDDFIF